MEPRAPGEERKEKDTGRAYKELRDGGGFRDRMCTATPRRLEDLRYGGRRG